MTLTSFFSMMIASYYLLCLSFSSVSFLFRRRPPPPLPFLLLLLHFLFLFFKEIIRLVCLTNQNMIHSEMFFESNRVSEKIVLGKKCVHRTRFAQKLLFYFIKENLISTKRHLFVVDLYLVCHRTEGERRERDDSYR